MKGSVGGVDQDLATTGAEGGQVRAGGLLVGALLYTEDDS